MKKLILIIAILIAGFAFKAEAKITPPAQYAHFYGQLSPYGSWVELNQGLVVWRPTTIRRTWSPYTQGQWIWTNQGWYWESYEPFGHVTYHYGRWWYDDYYGWIWIPDNEWGPAWVDWRYNDGYIGWAPLPPYATFSVHVGLHFSVNFHFPYHHWNYVTYQNFCTPYVNNYFVGNNYKYRVHSRTKYRNNYGYRNGRVMNRGVDVDLVRRRGNMNIREREIRNVRNPHDLNRKDLRGNDKYVRTYIADRDDIRRSNIDDVKIERSTRKTSLDVSKVNIGERRSIDDRNKKVVSDNTRNDRTVKNNNVRNSSTDVNDRKKTVRSKTSDRKVYQNNRTRVQKDSYKRTPDVRKNTRTNKTGVRSNNNRKETRTKSYNPPKRTVRNKTNNTRTYTPPKRDVNKKTYKNNRKKYTPPKRTVRNKTNNTRKYSPPKREVKQKTYKNNRKSYTPPKKNVRTQTHRQKTKSYTPPKRTKREYKTNTRTKRNDKRNNTRDNKRRRR